jgi:predicted RNase H-like nuclease (RuvC/YqgF family)
MNFENMNKSVDLWKVLTALAAVGVAGLTGGWVLGRTHIQDELEQYRTSEGWKVPNAIKKITVLAESLDSKLGKIQDYENLKKKNEHLTNENNTFKNTIAKTDSEYKSEVMKLSSEIRANEDTIKLLNDKVYQLTGASIFIKSGNALSVGNKALKVGVSDTNNYSKTARVVSGDYSNSSMVVGESFQKVVDGVSYTITLVSVQRTGASFSYDQKP